MQGNCEYKKWEETHMTNTQVFDGVHNYDMEKARETLEAKLNPSWIKQRKQGTATLSYIGGQTVIRLLNKAFNYQWSFEIVKEEIVQSQPKPAFDGWGKQRKPRLDENGNQVMEPQPPVAKVWGRLTIPGIGVKEQFGSQVLVGGATEQESAFKSAGTDALKKCATLVGVGLELYGEDEGMEDVDEDAVNAAMAATPQPEKKVQTPQQTKQEAPPQQPQAQEKPAAPKQEAAPAAGGWVQSDIDRLKELKAILGITDNAQLDPYVREFFDNPSVTFHHITPENVKAVNIFLAKKAEII